MLQRYVYQGKTPTSTGNVSFSPVDQNSNSFTPTVLIGFIVGATSSGSAVNNAILGMGWATGDTSTTQIAFGSTSENAVSTFNSSVNQCPDYFFVVGNPANSSYTNLIVASLTAFGSTCTLDFTAVSGSNGYEFIVIALGGDLSQAELLNFSCPGSTGNQTTTTTVTSPVAILFATMNESSSALEQGATASGALGVTLGWAVVGGSQACSQLGFDQDALQTTGSCIGSVGGTSTLFAANLYSAASDQFILDWTTVSSGKVGWALVLGGTFQAEAVSNTSPTSNGDQSNSLSFAPVCALLQTVCQASSGSPQVAYSQSIAYVDSGSNVASFTIAADFPPKSNSACFSFYSTSDAIVGYASATAVTTPTVSLVATLVDLTSEIKLDFTTTQSTAYQYIGLALGSAASTAPGAPTSLSAAYGSATSVGLSWTQGSGTVTDNEVQYQEAGAGSWTTIDIGSAATSYTVTALTNGQLYFFQVNAADSGDYSSYCNPVPWVCGANFCAQVGAATNNAYQSGAGTVTTGDSSDSIGTNAYLGFQFPNLGLGNSHPIISAVLWVYLTGVPSLDAPAIDCELSTSSATFSTSTDNLSNRTRTGAAVGWYPLPTESGWQESPNFYGAAQAVIGQYGWSSSDMFTVLVWCPSGLTYSFGPVEMYAGSATEAAVIAIVTGSPPSIGSRGFMVGTAAEQASRW